MNKKIIDLLNKDVPLVLATVVASSGSVPRRAGAKMLVSPSGLEEGSVGGGRCEALALEAAAEVLKTRLPGVRHFELKPGEGEAEAICGGALDILLEPLHKDIVSLFERAGEAGAGYWLLDLSESTRLDRMWSPEAALLPPQFAGSDLTRPGLVRGEGKVFYFEPAAAEHTVLLCGGGHIAKALANLLATLDFRLEVVENRAEFALSERFPSAGAVRFLPDFAHLAESCAIGADHYVVIVTHGHQHDFTVLEQALRTRARYIGMIGSRAKRDAIYATLNERGVPKAELACVCCPIGLDIGGQTPEEIAVAIAAELIAARNGRLHVKRRY